MISRSIHYSLSCDECGLSYGELGDIENAHVALRGSGWLISGNKHICNYCKDKYLKKLEEEGRDGKIADPETTQKHGARTENGWIPVAERLPETGLSWVLGRTPSGLIGVCRKSKSLSCWVDDRNEEIKEGIEYWNYLPAFP